MELDKTRYGVNIYRMPDQIKTIKFRDNNEEDRKSVV